VAACYALQLTRLLEDSLGGSSKTLLVVNCSPAAENANESKCSLDFAARARKVELGAAQRNMDTPGSPGSPAAGTPRMSGLSPLNTSNAGSNGGSTASSPRVNRSGRDLSSTVRLAASRRAGGLQQ
jgi:kinesin family protein C2/C3